MPTLPVNVNILGKSIKIGDWQYSCVNGTNSVVLPNLTVSTTIKIDGKYEKIASAIGFGIKKLVDRAGLTPQNVNDIKDVVDFAQQQAADGATRIVGVAGFGTKTETTFCDASSKRPPARTLKYTVLAGARVMYLGPVADNTKALAIAELLIPVATDVFECDCDGRDADKTTLIADAPQIFERFGGVLDNNVDRVPLGADAGGVSLGSGEPRLQTGGIDPDVQFAPPTAGPIPVGIDAQSFVSNFVKPGGRFGG